MLTQQEMPVSFHFKKGVIFCSHFLVVVFAFTPNVKAAFISD